jgi:hypothetical protein
MAALKNLAENGAKQSKEQFEQFRKDHQKEIDDAMKKLEKASDWIKKRH